MIGGYYCYSTQRPSSARSSSGKDELAKNTEGTLDLFGGDETGRLTGGGGEARVEDGRSARGRSGREIASFPGGGGAFPGDALGAAAALSMQRRRREDEMVCEGVGLARRYPYL